jgi:AmmeMemoRadiSam system protein B
VAASAYLTLSAAPAIIHRVVLLGPSHFVRIRGLALPTHDAFETPLGVVPVDDEARQVLHSLPQCAADDRAHHFEHSLEVQLPFLQRTLGEFIIVPIAVGRVEPEAVAEALDALGALRSVDNGTLTVISTDLSHYLDHRTATIRDRRTAAAVVAADHAAIHDRDACGARPLRGASLAAARAGLTPQLLDLRTAGDSSGDLERVVGYGAFVM